VKRIFVYLLLTGFISGCSFIETTVEDFVAGGEDNADPPAPLTDIKQKVAVSTLWSASVGGGSGKTFVRLTPRVSGGKIFSADINGKVTAHDAASGSLIWSAEVKEPITGGPGVGEGLVLVGTSEAFVIALDAASGTERWRKRVSSEVLASPDAGDDRVVARTVDGKVIGMDVATGRRLWVYDHKVPVLSLRGASSPVIDRGVAVVGFASGKMVAIRVKDGAVLWETRISIPRGRSDLARMVDIDSDPIVTDGVIHVATFQGNVATVALENGRVLWNRKMSSHAGMTIDKKNIYITDEESHVWALERRSGSSLWKQDKLHARGVSAPAVYDDMVVVGDFEGYVHILDSRDGGFLARTKLSGGSVVAPPQKVGDIVYVTSANGALTAIRPKK